MALNLKCNGRIRGGECNVNKRKLLFHSIIRCENNFTEVKFAKMNQTKLISWLSIIIRFLGQSSGSVISTNICLIFYKFVWQHFLKLQ